MCRDRRQLMSADLGSIALRCVLVLLAAGYLLNPASVVAQSESSALESLRIDELLVIERVGRGGRSAIFTDEIEYLHARGKWRTPNEGDAIELPPREGTEAVSEEVPEHPRWKSIEPGDDGSFQDPALRGGYAFATVDSPDDQVVIAHIVGARHLYVNGKPRVGDVYQLGYVKIPVRLVSGRNEFLFKAGRGKLRIAFEKPRAKVFISPHDYTLPDIIEGESQPVLAGLIVVNADRVVHRRVRVTATVDDGTALTTTLPVLPPLTTRKVAVMMPAPARFSDKAKVTLAIDGFDGGLELHLRGRKSDQWCKRTFVSNIDGSIQYYGVVPAKQSESGGDATVTEKPGLILSLHGAGVEGSGQAACYQAKDWAYVVAPTNRRPFGFDWEDWGRVDALEVLADAEERFGTDPRKTHVTGHSMGGHGTWQLGAHFPARFGGVAPSAAWRDFWTYGAPPLEVSNGIEAMFRRASNASRTALLLQNYAQSGVYILHGDDDKVVPVDQARLMRKSLEKFHTNWDYHEQEGAGHWWGNECMDYPALIEFLRENPLPELRNVRDIDFVTISPAISSECHWVSVETQRHSMQPSRVQLSFDGVEGRVSGETTNVARFSMDLSPFEDARKPRLQFRVDSQSFSVAWPSDGRVALERLRGAWRIAGPLNLLGKHPRRAGPFKEAFRNWAVLVYGTQGSGAETAATFAKARYDAETFWYRGNGAFEVIPDVDFQPSRYPHRNVILYGNADTNRAWSQLLRTAPIRVHRAYVQVGDKRFKGDDLACLFVYPRPDSRFGSVGVVAASGQPGMRLANQLPYFVSGAGFPDWAVFDVDMLRKGSAGIRGAGFFGADWGLASGQAAWGE